MRRLRRPSKYHLHVRPPTKSQPGIKRSIILVLVILAATALLPQGTSGAPPPYTGMPLVQGADLSLSASQLANDSSEAKEQSFKSDLALTGGARAASFTSAATQAPLPFTDVAPKWRAEQPDGTSITVEMRMSQDGQTWGPWQESGLEDLTMPQDPVSYTFGTMLSVGQDQRTASFVQSRITLQTQVAGKTPVLHELSYSFINAGVTPNPPQPVAMTNGTPSEVPKPYVVPRTAWGSPEGSSSPSWTPKYKRVTHIVIHHTATSNNDKDYAARVRAIWYYHAVTRGWGDIGYNFLIDPNGVIYEGRAGGDDVEAGHAYPFNSGTMGVGMIGDFMNQPPTAAAQAALIDLISWKVNQRGIDPEATEPITGYTDCDTTITYNRPTIAGHRDYAGVACGKPFNSSTCPGDKLWSMLPQIRAAVISDQPPLRASFIKHDTPGNLEPGSSADVHIAVRNTGSMTWPATGQGAVWLAYEWNTPDGNPVKGNPKASQTSLPHKIAFADTITLTARLIVPSVPGHYALVWDMVQDGTGRFADQGSRPLRVDVVVGKGGGDKTPPKSTILPLPVYSNNTAVVVRWAGNDEAKGSGIASYDIQYRVAPAGQWTDWKLGTDQTQATFDGDNGYTYEFRSRSRDAAGNVESWPDRAQAYTTVDILPPPINILTPTNGMHVMPGLVTVRGLTEPGAFVAVNDKRAEESGGVFTSTLQVAGRDFVIHVTAADQAGNVSRTELKIQAAPRYNDVPFDHPAFQAIESLSDGGIISGYGDGSFKPDAPLTRAALAKMLAITMQWNLINPPEARFPDVPADNWAYGYIETAAARGILDGYPDGTFRPLESPSRAEAIRAVVLAAGWKTPFTEANYFTDVPATHWLAPFVDAALQHGVLLSDDDGRFRPYTRVNRTEGSIWVYNMLASIQNEEQQQPPDDGGNER